MAGDLKTKLARMAQIKREKPAYKNLLDVYEKIFIAKEKFYQQLKANPMNFDIQGVETKFKAGYPVLDKNTIELDTGALEEFFCTLLLISRKNNPGSGSRLLSFIGQGKLDIKGTLRDMWQGKVNPQEWGKKDVGDPMLLYFLLTESLKPLYEYAAEGLRELIEIDLWGKGYCPVCGETPAMAAILEEKWSRILFCVHCGTEWPFPFLMCPFCGNEEEKGITYLYVQKEKQYRLEVCNACKKYLKAVDLEAIGGPAPLDVENVATLHLDILAQREGYGRGANYPLLI